VAIVVLDKLSNNKCSSLLLKRIINRMSFERTMMKLVVPNRLGSDKRSNLLLMFLVNHNELFMDTDDVSFAI
jgi:hypothetical protein